ncbi:unnamed protein product [Cylindrotheca closterium]|uniref:Uncharacterized protein n=1 Tax=Cylindrotheca closterium TaxID=2856 RepID=A0AAD2CE52_9STRA|nr:unnamed protein product [Cylindrotheca closterium]
MARLRKRLRKPATLNPSVIGILVFGGADPMTGVPGYRDAFAEAFSKKKCIEAWEKVGAAPCTRKCLQSHQVCHRIGDESDSFANQYKDLQLQNDFCVGWLNSHGLDGCHLAAKVDVIKKSELPGLTSMGTAEMQEKLMTANQSGKAFMLTAGHHKTHNDYFVAATLRDNEDEAKKLETIKKMRLELIEQAKGGRDIWEVDRNTEITKLTKTKLEKLLLWKGIGRKDQPKLIGV